MNLITNHPYISLTLFILILNFIVKKVTRAKYSPLTKTFLFIISLITQACSPFAGPVDKSVSDSYYYSKSKNDIYYSCMGNWFELGKTKLNADVKSFEVLGLDFGKDKNHLYFKDNIVDLEVDYDTFYVDKNNYNICFDKNHVYVPFGYLPYGFEKASREKNYLWKIPKADPKTFQKIDSDWAKDGSHFFYKYNPINVDYKSFETLNKNFAKDKNRVYLLETYKLLQTLIIDAPTTKKINDRYIADKNNVYDFQDSLIIIPYKNINDLKIIEGKFLLFDDIVIYNGTRIENANASSFHVIQFPYSKDENHVFYHGSIIRNADPKTFSIFKASYYSKDKNHIFYEGKLLKEADVATFGPSNKKNSLLYKDKNNIFRGNEIIKHY